MRNTQNITIGLLVVTAVILGAMLLSAYTTTHNTAYADTPVKGGDYILGTGAWTGKTDVVYVIDIATRRLVVYYANINNNAVDLVTTLDLEQEFTR